MTEVAMKRTAAEVVSSGATFAPQNRTAFVVMDNSSLSVGPDASVQIPAEAMDYMLGMDQHSFQDDLDSLLNDFSDSSDAHSSPVELVPLESEARGYSSDECNRDGIPNNTATIKTYNQLQPSRVQLLLQCPLCQKLLEEDQWTKHLEAKHNLAGNSRLVITRSSAPQQPPTRLPQSHAVLTKVPASGSAPQPPPPPMQQMQQPRQQVPSTPQISQGFAAGPSSKPSPPAKEQRPVAATRSSQLPRTYICHECGQKANCITSLTKHVRKAHDFAISVRSPYFGLLKSSCCKSNSCSGTGDKRSSSLAPSVMQADASKVPKLPTKKFRCQVCNIFVRREDILDHQIVHLKDKLSGTQVTQSKAPQQTQTGTSVSLPSSVVSRKSQEDPQKAVISMGRSPKRSPQTLTQQEQQRLHQERQQQQRHHQEQQQVVQRQLQLAQPHVEQQQQQQLQQQEVTIELVASQPQPSVAQATAVSTSTSVSPTPSGGSEVVINAVPAQETVIVPTVGPDGNPMAFSMDVNALLQAVWAGNRDQIPMLFLGSSVISYCRACWKACQMHIPPSKTRIDVNEFHCVSCSNGIPSSSQATIVTMPSQDQNMQCVSGGIMQMVSDPSTSNGVTFLAAPAYTATTPVKMASVAVLGDPQEGHGWDVTQGGIQIQQVFQ